MRAIQLMGINLHAAEELSREVDQSDVTTMRKKMTEHSEETNELFNLMARQIKKRCEERVNLYTVEYQDPGVQTSSMKPDNLMDESEMDQFILNDN